MLRGTLPREENIIDLSAPEDVEHERGPVDHSYVNHLMCNAGVVACTFDDSWDADPLDILAAYPGHRVIGIGARATFAPGGGTYGTAQQEPAIPGGPRD